MGRLVITNSEIEIASKAVMPAVNMMAPALTLVMTVRHDSNTNTDPPARLDARVMPKCTTPGIAINTNTVRTKEAELLHIHS